MLQAIWKPMIWIAVVAMLALPALAGADDAGEEDIPITDPMLLERLGFDPDATDVYATPQAYEQLLMSPAEQAALQEARLEGRLAAQESEPAGGPYGTQTPGFSTLDAASFHAIKRTGASGETSYEVIAPGGLLCHSGRPIFYAQFESLPHGARLEWVDVWDFDESPESVTTRITRHCNGFLSPGFPTQTILGSVSSSGDGGHGVRSMSIGEDIDQSDCFYRASVFLDDDTGVGSSCSEGLDLRLVKVRAQWRRQVSPAPGTATFGDVPTSHPFFQHIEALAASGITSGCGGSDFCPNGPLTRGQMAAFLAKALGLHW